MSSVSVTRAGQFTGHKAAIYGLCPGPEEGTFFTGGGEGWIARWSLTAPDEGQLIATVPANIFVLQYLPQHELLVAGEMNGGLYWIPLASPEQYEGIAHHQKGLFAILQWKDQLITGGGDGLLTRWSIARQRPLESIRLCRESIRHISLHPEREEFIVGASNNSIFRVHPERLEALQVLENAHDNSVFCGSFTAGGQTFCSGGRDAQLSIWQVDEVNWRLRQRIPAHLYTVNDMALHPNQTLLATASRDKTIKLWDTRDWSLLKVLDRQKYQGHLNSVNRVCWLGETGLISVSDDRSIIWWQVDIE